MIGSEQSGRSRWAAERCIREFCTDHGADCQWPREQLPGKVAIHPASLGLCLTKYSSVADYSPTATKNRAVCSSLLDPTEHGLRHACLSWSYRLCTSTAAFMLHCRTSTSQHKVEFNFARYRWRVWPGANHDSPATIKLLQCLASTAPPQSNFHSS
jgi:hypothetical protein